MALKFVENNDFKGVISDKIFTTLSGDASVNLESAEALAVSELAPLHAKYNIDGELAKTGDGRNGELVRIMVNITAYYLYNKTPDDEIPERISDNFKKEIRTIEKIAGNMSSTLDLLSNTDGTKKTSFRYGGDPARSHNPF